VPLCHERRRYLRLHPPLSLILSERIQILKRLRRTGIPHIRPSRDAVLGRVTNFRLIARGQLPTGSSHSASPTIAPEDAGSSATVAPSTFGGTHGPPCPNS